MALIGTRSAIEPFERVRVCARLYSSLNPHFTMLGYAITFLIIAIIAAVLGFGGIAGAAAGIAKILFFLFLVLFIAALIFGRRKPPV